MFERKKIWAFILAFLAFFVRYFKGEEVSPLPAAGQSKKARARGILGMLKMGSREWGFLLYILGAILDFFNLGKTQPEAEMTSQQYPESNEERADKYQAGCIELIDSVPEEPETEDNGQKQTSQA